MSTLAETKEQLQYLHNNRFQLVKKLKKLSNKKQELQDDLDEIGDEILDYESRIENNDQQILKLSHTLLSLSPDQKNISEPICDVVDQFAKIESDCGSSD